MALVSHQHALGKYVSDVYTAVFLEHVIYRRGKEILDLQQIALYFRIPHGPGAKSVAPFKGYTVGPVAMDYVFNYIDDHVMRYNTSSRADGKVVVA